VYAGDRLGGPIQGLPSSGYSRTAPLLTPIPAWDNTLFDHQASGRAGLKAFLRHLQANPSADLASFWFEIEQLSYHQLLSKETFAADPLNVRWDLS
jgi:hypothetical protein